MRDAPPFGMRAFFLIAALPFGFELLLTPEDFGLWIILWAGYMTLFALVNVWRGRIALGLLAPTAAFVAVGYTDRLVVGPTLIGAAIAIVLMAACLRLFRQIQLGRWRSTTRADDSSQLVAVAAKRRPTDASAADVLAHFGLGQEVHDE